MPLKTRRTKAAPVANLALEPGDDPEFNRKWGGRKYIRKQVIGSGTIKATSSVFGGFQVVVATAVGAINIRAGGSTGELIVSIPAATAAMLAPNMFDAAVPEAGGLYVEYVGGATGTINIYHL